MKTYTKMVLLLSLIAGGCDQTIVEEHWYEDTDEIECDWTQDTDSECLYGDVGIPVTESVCIHENIRRFSESLDGFVCLQDPVECRSRPFRTFRTERCSDGCYRNCAGGLAICGEDMIDEMPGYFLSGTAECAVAQ